MARLMACNDETDGGRDKRDMHVRGHYSSAARTHIHSYTQTANATQGCRRSRLPPTSLFFSPSFVFSLSPSCSSHPPSVPLCLLLFFLPFLDFSLFPLRIYIIRIKSSYSSQTVKLVFTIYISSGTATHKDL